ncbi:MAG: GDP-mannose 4,6-dehydratase, partial [Candidatus Liptonbacteria bacterium]|nr:GDP-mannose 4,6-dehydratase [Candidatus Liptonbacteria bacterium]
PKGEAGVVPIFYERMRMGKQPTIFGNGSKTRDYVHVEDVARANVLALAKGRNEIVNIGTGKAITDREVFDAVAHHTGFKGLPRYAPVREGEVRHIRLSATRAQKILGWKPKVTFPEGIQRTLSTPRAR